MSQRLEDRSTVQIQKKARVEGTWLQMEVLPLPDNVIIFGKSFRFSFWYVLLLKYFI